VRQIGTNAPTVFTTAPGTTSTARIRLEDSLASVTLVTEGIPLMDLVMVSGLINSFFLSNLCWTNLFFFY
jgi:hypothetical protein